MSRLHCCKLIFFGKCCRRAQIQKLSPMQSKILVLLLQGYIEHDVYFWQRYVIEWFLGSNHCSNNEQKVATQNDGGSRLIFFDPFNIMTVSVSFSVPQQISHYLPPKNVAAKQISLPPAKRFSMHGLEVYSFFSVKYANPVFPL